MTIFILVLVALVCCFIFYKIGQKTSQIEREQENKSIRQVNERLEQEYANKQRAITESNSKLQELDFAINTKQNEYNAMVETLALNFKEIESDYILREADMSHKLDLVKDDKFSKINEAATKYREKLHSEIKAETAAAMLVAQKAKDLILEDCKKVKLELLDLLSQRDAIIEANRREEEKKLQKEFYRIRLDENSLNDIKLLLSIEKHLYNKEPLYKLIWNNFYMTPVKEMLNRVVGKDKSSGIYKITNDINGKIYIGQSVDLHTRITNHIKAALGIGTIAHQTVHDAMAADGLENFSFEIIEYCSKEQLNKKEKLWIETYASNKYGYNRTAGGAKED